ncbi:CoA-binding protein [Pollutibacter soli]|uniref:CoA-binding protein n=1 Tax=Pollutibacter soli TaxID=3034157 RepID=UPI003013BB70
MENKKSTLVLGASDNPSRYSFLALNRLRAKGHPVNAIGKKKTRVGDVEIADTKSEFKDIDTVTLYLNPTNQQPYYDYILSLAPKRIIFNPGTENPELEKLAEEKGIETMEACTLVLLSTGQY